KACLAAGLIAGVDKRRVVLLRNATWDLGVKTMQLVDQFRADGGLTLTVDEHDLKVFAALRQLFEDKPAGLAEWLAASRPASSTRLLREVFAETTPSTEPVVAPALLIPERQTESQGPTNSFPFGMRFEDGTLFYMPLESLRKHTAIFAGSGSGKT